MKRVIIDSCWNNEEEVKNNTAEWLKKYNVRAEFNDGGDCYSSWELIGNKEDIEKCISENWGNPGELDVEIEYEDVEEGK